MVFPTRSQFNSTVLKQFFVLPDSIIYYISKNPISPKCYKKMVQTCKYFFIQNSIIILNKSYCNPYGKIFVDVEQKPFDLKKISASKLWITGKFQTCTNKDLSFVLSKIYRFDGKILDLWFQTIFYDELLILSSNVETLKFMHVNVKCNDGSIVSLEKIIEAFPKILAIQYHDFNPSYISTQTVKNLFKIPQFLTLHHCSFGGIPEDFDIESFYTYLKTNKRTSFWIEFSDKLSDAYKNRMEEIIDEIIEDENRDYKPPYLRFRGLNQEKEKKLFKNCHRDSLESIVF